MVATAEKKMEKSYIDNIPQNDFFQFYDFCFFQ